MQQSPRQLEVHEQGECDVPQNPQADMTFASVNRILKSMEKLRLPFIDENGMLSRIHEPMMRD